MVKISHLGLARNVRMSHQQNELDQAEEIARYSVDDECQMLLATLRAIAMSIFVKVTEQDCSNDFTSFLKLIPNITDRQDRLCMAQLLLVFKYSGFGETLNGYRKFREFVEKTLVKND